MTAEKQYSLAELAAASGVAARTIRYYIARGVLMPPLRPGRNAAYGEPHLERLSSIARWQAAGESLAAIARRLGSGEPAPAGAGVHPEAWWRYELGADIVVMVRAGAAPWRLRAARRWMQAWTESEREEKS